MFEGEYDPYYLTGLGSLLWVVEKYHSNMTVATTALYHI